MEGHMHGSSAGVSSVKEISPGNALHQIGQEITALKCCFGRTSAHSAFRRYIDIAEPLIMQHLLQPW
jgi:hypothetical protein